MYESGVNSEVVADYNLLFCQACLSSNRALTTVGDCIDVYLKICENSRLNCTSKINICWECMALLKKVRSFKKKVDNAQKILDYRVNKQAPLEDSLSTLTISSTEVTTFIPVLIEDEDEYGDENEIKSNVLEVLYDPRDDLDKSIDILEDSCELKDDLNKSIDILEDSYDPKDELMIKIADVRGQCDICDDKPVLNVSVTASLECDVTVKMEPLSPEASEQEQGYQRWRRAVMLVYKRICGHKYARYFLRPVSDEVAPCYSRVVRRPTDLMTIKRKVREGLIRTTKDFRHALLLMFSNALMYNGSDYNIYDMTMELRNETIRELEILEAAEAHANSPLFTLPPPRRRALDRDPSPSRLLCPPQTPRTLPARPVSPPTIPASHNTLALKVKKPRASLPARPVSPPTLPPSPPSPLPLPAPPRRKRWDWSDWPEHEHLVAIKKYKTPTTVLL